MAAIKGDFIGFTFGGIHSSDLGIVRVSNGSRYTETLLPEFSNKTVNVPGADRTNYLGMEYTQRPFPLEIAFDSVTETQLRDMKRLFSSKKPLPLIFDESPYKTYYANAASPPSLSYICFDESEWGGEKRVYKGEGKIDLVSFYPYAFCDPLNLVSVLTYSNYSNFIIPGINTENFKRGFYGYVGGYNRFSLSQYVSSTSDGTFINFGANATKVTYNYKTGTISWDGPKGNSNGDFIFYILLPSCNNFSDWWETTGLSEFNFHGIEQKVVSNPGDFETPFQIYGTPKANGNIKLEDNILSWSGLTLKDGDEKVRFNGFNELIEGIDSDGNITNNIYNGYISGGNWYKIPKDFGTTSRKNFVFTGFSCDKVQYKILYI